MALIRRPTLPAGSGRQFLAVSEGGQDGFSFLWWKSGNDTEPCVIFISGGTVEFYADLNELVEYLANGKFPECGFR
ncbi:hypothetical protein [Rhizobium sp. L245/93]|uniref:hypothetical protein n=1 Tax=Rhizobium sp. L245/93 TaxID=2819998 RepID=UPI001AD98CBD|nr:hypothetical protein [Rhizobium sp. L245/93]MBO9170483.1 hypothetical protein [Rhizobium sp. L245/93]